MRPIQYLDRLPSSANRVSALRNHPNGMLILSQLCGETNFSVLRLQDRKE